MAPTLPATTPGLRLISCLSEADRGATTEQEQRRTSRERSIANHPAFRRRATGGEATVASLPVRLHAVPDPSA